MTLVGSSSELPGRRCSVESACRAPARARERGNRSCIKVVKKEGVHNVNTLGFGFGGTGVGLGGLGMFREARTIMRLAVPAAV